MLPFPQTVSLPVSSYLLRTACETRITHQDVLSPKPKVM